MYKDFYNEELSESQEPKTNNQNPAPKPNFGDLISQYPVELHPTYQKRMEVWLKACSLKMQLNEVSILPTNEKQDIWDSFQVVEIA